MRPRLSLLPILGLCLFPVLHQTLLHRLAPENFTGVGVGVGVALLFYVDLFLSLFLFVLGYTSLRPSFRRIGLLGAAILPAVLLLVTVPSSSPGRAALPLVLHGTPLVVILLMGLLMNVQGKLRDTPLK